MKKKTAKEWYQVREVVLYELKARSTYDAEKIIVESEKRDKYCIEVEERESWKV
jgi:hypothetical protein